MCLYLHPRDNHVNIFQALLLFTCRRLLLLSTDCRLSIEGRTVDRSICRQRVGSSSIARYISQKSRSYDWLSVVLSWYQATIWDLVTNFSLSWKLSSDICGFLRNGFPLWREGGSVIYSYKCYWAFSSLSLSGPSPAELQAIFYCLVWDWVLPTVAFPDSRGYGGGILTRLHMKSYTRFFTARSKRIGTSLMSSLVLLETKRPFWLHFLVCLNQLYVRTISDLMAVS
jgi:hypothetical protein